MVHLAPAPARAASASFQFGERTLPLLPEAAAALAARGSPFADADALAAAVVLIASFFADPRGGRALEAHADAHAGAMLGALRTLAGAGGEGKGRERASRDEPSVIVGMERSRDGAGGARGGHLAALRRGVPAQARGGGGGDGGAG